MKKILFLFLLLPFLANGQTYTPSQHILSSTATGYSNASPTDGRSMFFDNTNFKYRDFQSTSEVITYLSLPKYRSGHFPIFVHNGGTLSAGIWAGGTMSAYWFRDCTDDSCLVFFGGGISSSSDYSAPVLVSASVGNYTPDIITLTYNEPLNPAFLPVDTDYTISPALTISAVFITGGNTLNVRVTTSFTSTDVITISGGNSTVRDTAGNTALNLSARTVTNNVTNLVCGDDFNRANNPSSMGFLTVPNTPWNYGTGTWGISGNKGYCVLTTTGATVVNTAYVETMISNYVYEVDVTLVSLNSDAAIMFRYVDDANFLAVDFNTTGGTLYKMAGGVFTTLGSFILSSPFGAQKRWRVVTSGNALSIYRNGGSPFFPFALVTSATESFQNTATKVGLIAVGGAAFGGNVLFDNLSLH